MLSSAEAGIEGFSLSPPAQADPTRTKTTKIVTLRKLLRSIEFLLSYTTTDLTVSVGLCVVNVTE